MQLTGGEIIAEYLIKEKVPYIVGIPGHGILGVVDALKERQDKIKTLMVRHEQSAVHLADGYYRVTGQPLAVFTSIGPGAINTAIGVATAYVDSTAVLVITGDTHTHMFGKGVLQEIERQHNSNFPRIMEPIVKRYWQVTDVAQLPHIMQRAFGYMMTGRRGPVLISMPMDVQCDSADVEIPEPEERKPMGRILPDPKAIDKAVKLLARSKRPVILAGGGVIASDACNELRQLAELLDSAVVTTMMGKSAFPENHPLYGWHTGSKGTTCGNKLTSSADVLLAVGCRFADETTSSYKHGVSFSIPPTELIHIDIDENEIGKNYPCKVGIVADAKSALSQIIEGLKSTSMDDRRFYAMEIKRLVSEWFDSMREFREYEGTPTTISRMLVEIRDFLDDDAIVVSSSGNTQAQILQEFPFYMPRTCLTTGGFSTMGFTVPASIGAKLAYPNRQVIGILGDGDFMMTMQELSTAVQYGVPIVIVIANNMGWISIKDLQTAVYGADRTFATDFVKPDGSIYSPDFKAIASAFGCFAQRVENGDDIKPALEKAFESGKTSVIEVIVERNFPFSGGKVAGWWDVPVPTYLRERREKYERERSEEKLI
ncbi:TPA: thiamine pyrophosphate-binding protein [Candidatus Poribacteria bacterium]|nr:thiamine pyrophosphate-binding protein [Candidatus Poribacteria bacterium]